MILTEIVERKREEVEAAKAAIPLPILQKAIAYVPPPAPFEEALASRDFALIAEIKKASPSAGVIVPDFDPLKIAIQYKAAGAAALSILTERNYFQGDLDTMRYIKKEIGLPVLRKDFIFDPYQIFEAKMYGADAVLLIAAILPPAELQGLAELTHSMELAPLIEVHTPEEAERALSLNIKIIGINNRDLQTFQVDLETTPRLIQKFPELKRRILISESGIARGADAAKLRQAGVRAILVGENLLRSQDIPQKIAELMGTP